MDAAWTTLQELCAVDEAGKLTALGKYMVKLPPSEDKYARYVNLIIQSMLPVDVRLGKVA